MNKFVYYPTPLFEGKLKKIRKNDPQGFARIRKVIDRILGSPADADGRMQVKHHSRYKKYVGKKDYRLIYEWCEHCRKQDRKREERCGHCDEIVDHSVVFFDVYHKNEMNRVG